MWRRLDPRTVPRVCLPFAMSVLCAQWHSAVKWPCWCLKYFINFFFNLSFFFFFLLFCLSSCSKPGANPSVISPWSILWRNVLKTTASMMWTGTVTQQETGTKRTHSWAECLSKTVKFYGRMWVDEKCLMFRNSTIRNLFCNFGPYFSRGCLFIITCTVPSVALTCVSGLDKVEESS